MPDLADIMLPLFEREKGLRPSGLGWMGSAETRVDWLLGVDEIGVETATQLCESQMVRWLVEQTEVRFTPAKCADGDGYYITATNDSNPKMFYNGSDQFRAPTLVAALAEACTAVLEAKEQDPA